MYLNVRLFLSLLCENKGERIPPNKTKKSNMVFGF